LIYEILFTVIPQDADFYLKHDKKSDWHLGFAQAWNEIKKPFKNEPAKLLNLAVDEEKGLNRWIRGRMNDKHIDGWDKALKTQSFIAKDTKLYDEEPEHFDIKTRGHTKDADIINLEVRIPSRRRYVHNEIARLYVAPRRIQNFKNIYDFCLAELINNHQIPPANVVAGHTNCSMATVERFWKENQIHNWILKM
jgi:hypothetical protein